MQNKIFAQNILKPALGIILLTVCAVLIFKSTYAEDAKNPAPAPAAVAQTSLKPDQQQANDQAKIELQNKIDEIYRKAKDYFDNDQIDLAQEAFSKIPSLAPEDLRAKEYLEKKIPQKIEEKKQAAKKSEEARAKQEKTLQGKIAALEAKLAKLKEASKSEDVLKQVQEAEEKVQEADQKARDLENQKKAAIDKLYKEGSGFFDANRLAQATESFNKIIAIDPNQQKAKDYLEQKIPRKSRDLESAAKKAQEEFLKKEEELKKQQDMASGKTELEKVRKEKSGLEATVKQIGAKEKELDTLKENLKNLASSQDDIQQQVLALKKEKEELLKKDNLLESETKRVKDLNAQLEAKAKEFFIQSKDAQSMRENLNGLSRAMDAMIKERTALQKRNAELEEKSGKVSVGNAEIYQELGTAYTKAKLYDQAIVAYNKALSFNHNNAQVHYYLGLLYQRADNDRKKAIYHLKKYIQLAQPKPSERNEVQYLIEVLQEAPKHEVTPSFKN